MTSSTGGDLRLRAAGAAVVAVPSLVAVALLADPAGAILVASYLIPGLVLLIRRPRQPIAWLLLLATIGLGLGTMHPTATLEQLQAGTAGAVGRFTAWANGVGWTLVFVALGGIGLLFPNGSLPRGGWGIYSRIVIVVSLPIAVATGFGPTVNVTLPGAPGGAEVPNPYALPLFAGLRPWSASLWIVLFGLTVAAMLPLVARFRASTGVERLQYRWLAWAVVVVGIGTIVWAAFVLVARVDGVSFLNLVVLATYPAIPIAIVVAMLRYRLYEIDRLVSRTIGWATATAGVVAVFVTGVLALQALLADVTQGETLAVAVSTLLAAVAFQPVRARVQAAVDRRFDRPRLVAEQTLAVFGERLQHEVDLPALTRDVERTVVDMVRPAAAGLWVRREPGSRAG